MSGKIVCNNESLKQIVKERYEKCPYVIDVSDLDTSECTSFEKLFYSFKELRLIKEFNTLDTSNVQTMRNMCFCCFNLQRLTLTGLNLSNVQNISHLCDHCYNLQSLNLSGLNLSNVNNINEICGYCYHLQSLDLSGLNLSKVINMSDICDHCYNLQSLNLSGLNLSNVQRMDGLCRECYALQSLNLSGSNLSNVQRIGDMCGRCGALTMLTPPDIFPAIQEVKNQLDNFIAEANKLSKALQQFDIQIPQPIPLQQPPHQSDHPPLPAKERKANLDKLRTQLLSEKQHLEKLLQQNTSSLKQVEDEYSSMQNEVDAEIEKLQRQLKEMLELRSSF